MILIFVLLLVGAGVLGAGILYQQSAIRRDRRLHPPLGQIVSVAVASSSRLHLHLLEQGVGEPAVLLEAGVAGSLLGWSLVQERLAAFTRAISYDRAGLGWSSKPLQPRTLDNMLSELHALLTEAKVQQPLVLVGHSFGGLLVRAFAHRWPDRVAGLVLVDPVGHAGWAKVSVSEQARLRRGIMLSRRGALLAEIGMVRAALQLLVSGRRWLPKLVSKVSAGSGASVLERLIGEVRLLPDWSHAKIRAHWSDARCFRAMADYLEAVPHCASGALDLAVAPQIPVAVLSAHTATVQELAERDAWVAASYCGRHIRVAGGGHWLQIQRPDVVIEAIRETVQFLRRGATEEPSASIDSRE